MATIKSFTDLNQSMILAGYLPIESADMKWFVPADDESESTEEVSLISHKSEYALFDKVTDWNDTPYIPCWSQTALYNMLPVVIGNVLEKNALRLRIDKGETDFNVWYDNLDTGSVVEGLDIVESNPVDAYYKMIVKLHEQKLL